MYEKTAIVGPELYIEKRFIAANINPGAAKAPRSGRLLDSLVLPQKEDKNIEKAKERGIKSL